MNRKMRREAGGTPTRAEKVAQERARQQAIRDDKCIKQRLIPYWNKKREELVPNWSLALANGLIAIITPVRKMVGHMPPLALAQAMLSQRNAFIMSPASRVVVYLLTAIVGLVGAPVAFLGLLIDWLIIAPLEWVRMRFATFGLSFKIVKTNEWGNENVLTIKKWWREVDVSHWEA